MAAEIAKCVFSIDARQAIDTINVFGSRLDGIGNLANAAKAAIGGIFSGGILKGAKYFVDQASDAQETTSKFGVVFQSVSKQADAAVRKLVNTYNMSTHAARTALSDTGDLLSGFGLTGAAALDLAEKVNQLGSDLASFTNYEGGSKGAAEALTKALLGEREQAKMLGIAILEEQVQAQILADKKQGITYASQQEAKAYATLKIAQRQSVNAIGDAERSTTSYAYNTNKLSNNLDDLKRNIGAALIEPATKIAKGLANCVEWVNNLNPALLKWGTILTVTGGFIGGAVVGITGLIGTIRTYMGIQRLASVATANSTQQTSVNTVATGTNSQSVATSTVSRNSSTVAVEAHTAALIRNTQASNANSISNSAKRNGISLEKKPKNSISLEKTQKNGISLEKSPKRGISLEKSPKSNISLTKTPKSSISLTKAPKTGIFLAKAPKSGISLAKAAPLPGKGVLGIGKSISGVFGKIPSLIMKPLSLITGLFGKSKLLTTILSFGAKFAGFAVPFVGWGSAIVTGVGLAASAFKRMPEWLEIFIQDFWPKIKSGSVYIVKKVAAFLSPGNLWGMIQSGIFGFGKLLKDGWNGAVNVVKRLAGYETEAQKAYSAGKIAKSLEESRKWTKALADEERKLIEQRRINIEATKLQAKGLAEEMLGKFDTSNESKQKARKKTIDEEQKKLESMGIDSSEKKDLLSKRNLFMTSYKKDEFEMARLGEELNKTEVGSGRFKEIEEKRKTLAKSMEFNKGQVEGFDTQLKAFNIDPKAVTDQFGKVIGLKADDAIETAKENREAAKEKSETAFGFSILGKTGTEKTKVLGDRVTELQAKEKADRDAYNKQEETRARLKEIAADENDPVNAALALAAVNGDGNALKQLGEGYDSFFKDMAPMLKESDLLQNAQDVQSAKDELRDQQAADRALTYKKQETADQKRVNLSGGKLQVAENVYGDVKKKALAMNTGEFKTATAKYVTALSQAYNEEDLAIRHKIANINKEMEATTDAEKLADLEAEKLGLENDIQTKQREHNKKIEDTYKERDEIERERTERQKALKQNIQKSLDESLLKEAKTGRQRLSIYGGQYMRAMQEYRTAKNSEKKFEAIGKVKEASDSINGEIEAMAKKQEERNKNVWTTAAPQKAVTAGSTEAYSIQNKLYNSFQRNVERNTKDMVGLNKRMIAELQTLNSQQQSEYTLDVKV